MKELMCLTPLDFKPEYTLETFEKLIKPLRLKKVPIIVFETMHKRKDGTLYPVSIRLQLMHEEFDPVFVAVIEDISERKHADAVLKQIVVGTSAAIGDDFLKSLVKNLATSLDVKYAFIGELTGDQWERVTTRAVWANGALAENFEYDWKGTPCENVMVDNICYYPNNAQALFPQDLLLVEMGVESYLGVALYDNEKKIGGFLVVLHDEEISEGMDPKAILQVFANRVEAELERRKAERKLEKYLGDLERLVSERTAALEKSNQNLSDFAFIAAHDLQEPLRKVTMFGNMLKKSNQDLDEKSCDCIDRMQSAITRMQSLIDDLLVYSKLSTQDLPYVKIDLNRIVENTLTDLETQIHQARGTINVDKLPDLEANPVQMHQLFQNLISNALKYRKEDVDPVINISSRSNDNGVVTISVEDNGIGFDEKYKDRIFQLFQRLHGNNAYGGTGIGLAICKKIIDRHHGTITVNSTPGGGAIFKFSLPEMQARNVEGN
ncbi:MAG: PAS domain S-box protein [Nitrospinae bacterium]|nr:PAS domain S-box protein [Nitrospinota bacterium]MBL7019447.1 PAS domain S-box protein [Nitrospinaceae bacterium]